MAQMSDRKSISLRVAGMDCAEEVAALRGSLAGVEGLQDLKFDVLNARVTVEYDPAVVELDVIHAAIHRAGMRSEPWNSKPGSPFSKWHSNARLIASGISAVALLLAVLDDAHSSGNWMLAFLTQGESGSPAGLYRKLLFGAAIVSGLWFIAPKAWRSLRARRADMNVLMLVSVFGAMVLGEYSEAATVCFLFSVSALLEGWSMGQARKAIRSLLHVTPQSALVRHGDHEHRVAVETIRVGWVIIVKPGERIPCDGEVIGGRSRVNQALLTQVRHQTGQTKPKPLKIRSGYR
jgi:Zn2+/Cd2+-exporting ATPase